MNMLHEHAADAKYEAHRDGPGRTEGGKCITAHFAGRDKTGKLVANSCNYRWQAYQRAATKDASLYNWPKYQSLAVPGRRIRMRLRFGWRTTKAPEEGDWDVKGDNFRTSCNVPYWHESHHIVPHGELRDAINSVGRGANKEKYKDLIRSGLLAEGYNINHHHNMIMLPMDGRVARAIGLPRHRQTPGHWSHRAYSNAVRLAINDVFKPMRESESRHVPPEYVASKARMEIVSRYYRRAILACGGGVSLDEGFASLKMEQP